MELSVPSTRTVAEVNGRLLPEDTQSCPACPDADLTAGEGSQPERPVGHVFCPGGEYPPHYTADDGCWSNTKASPASALPPLARTSQAQAPAPQTPPQGATGTQLSAAAAAAAPRGLAWHPTRPLLAAADAADGVQVYDYTGHIPYLGQHRGELPPPLPPAHRLHHELQTGVTALAWRPNAGATLAAGCAHGACLWQLAKGGAAGAGASLTWLQLPGGGAATTLAWHPRGHLLAAASHHRPDLHIWDVATGSATVVRAGLAPVSLLRWSPCGCYLLAGHATGGFRIWETSSWGSTKWGSGGGSAAAPASTPAAAPSAGTLVDAAWSPDGRTLLLAHARQLSTLHLTAEPPSLAAQALPVSLPELARLRGDGSGLGGVAAVEAMAWDPRGQRLALAMGGGGHPAAGCVALYDTQRAPILSVRFVGFVRAAPLLPHSLAAHREEHDWEIVDAEEAGGSAAAGGAKEAIPAAVQLAFLPAFAQGALLSVRQGDAYVATIPMYFSS